MKKLFVSLPMKGRNRDEIREKQWAALEEVRKLLGEPDGIILIDSWLEGAPEGLNPGLWCLGESLKRMAKADIVYFCQGAESARGCRIEHRCARAYNMSHITETEHGWVFFRKKEK